MDKTKERRREKRLQYELPVWYAEDLGQKVSQGVMVDISNKGMAFTCSSGEGCPHPGQKLVTRFSIPDFESQEGSAMKDFTRTGSVCRVDKVSEELCRVAIQFDEPPPFWNEPPAK